MNKHKAKEYIKKVEKAPIEARRKALKLHKAFGVPIVTEKNGKNC